MRKKIAAHEEPWYSAYQANFGKSDPNRPTHAVAVWAGDYMSGDPVVAHQEALQWALTGDAAHAANAIKILNAWSSTLTTITTHKVPG